ncbi:MAG: beta-lactamase family protein [Synergistaceae bacterium]|nr:beta-lactamase family protein [Synergistaceae bacterium]
MKRIIEGFSYSAELLKRFTCSGVAVGVAAMVMKKGETVFCDYSGYADLANRIPVGEDTIYRIFSMTKPVTVVALLKLYEQGYFRMFDPVSKFLPQFGETRYYHPNSFSGFEVRKSDIPLEIGHLFTMTAGLPYPVAKYPSCARYKEVDIPPYGGDFPMEKLLEELGAEPLSCAPGSRFLYGYGTDVLGGVLEAITGMRLGDFMRREIFEPLGMKDTGFYLNEEQASRLSGIYEKGEDGAWREAVSYMRPPLVRPSFESGGAGLYSTMQDYNIFAQMLLKGGSYEGARILGRNTVRFMSSNHLTPAQLAAHSTQKQRGYGYGLGVRVLTDPAQAGLNCLPGEFGWSGAAGTWFCVDPNFDMTALLMVQRIPGDSLELSLPFMAGIYANLD